MYLNNIAPSIYVTKALSMLAQVMHCHQIFIGLVVFKFIKISGVVLYKCIA